MKNEYTELEPLNGDAKQLMIMLHGLGSDCNDLISLAQYFMPALPNCHFFSLNGVEEYDMAPFGRQWFSLQDRRPQIILPLIDKNILLLQDIIKAKQEELGIDNSQTIILGFSQGTMMGVRLNLLQDKPFGAVIGYSGRLIEPENLKNTSTPICIIHGREDEVVPVSESEKLAAYCTKHSITHHIDILKDLEHSIDARGIEIAKTFLRNIWDLV